MFERFTDRARRVLVLAQEEARLLNHNHIGTEHLLLGLIHEHEGIAAQALVQMDISLEAVREKVEETIVLSGGPPIGSPPFTPRAKKVLELSLREALQLGHSHIGTEHLLLGLIKEGEGVGAQVLVTLGVDLYQLRQKVIDSLKEYRSVGGQWQSIGAAPPSAVVACSFCGRQPPKAGQLFTGDDASICEHCVRRWSEQLGVENDSPDDE
jgi:ATP-dependent Clp protease ATP-binding subunit ClpC